MALDRQDIERRDFPIGRRGYEPEAVDAHLRRVADELDELRRAVGEPAGPASLASAAAEEVRAIVEAAETTASDIKREAQVDASSIRARAEADAETTRSGAGDQVRRHVAGVREAAQTMLQRIEAMENELNALTESLRTGASRLTADLTLLTGDVGELRSAAAGASERVEAVGQPLPEPETPDAPTGPQAEGEAGAEGRPQAAVAPAEPEAADDGGSDSEGARLIALNMALNGTPREEADRYLADNFQLSDRGKLLDEVYARVG